MKIQLNFEDNKLSHIWLRKAEAVYGVAQRAMNARRKPVFDHVCIWSEQAAAWYLMALLAKRNKRYSIDENVMSLIKKALRVDTTFKPLLGYCNASMECLDLHTLRIGLQKKMPRTP